MATPTYSGAKVPLRIFVAFLFGLLGMIAAGFLASVQQIVRSRFFDSAPWLEHDFGNHTGMLLASLLLITILSQARFSTYGFRLPKGRWLAPLALFSCGISAIAFLGEKTLPGQGLPFAQEYTFLEQVLRVWIYASIAEELLTRGLIQGYLSPLSDRGLSLGSLRLSIPVIVGAVFFGLMHLGLLTIGIEGSTVAQIVVFALLVGLVAGYYREKTESLIPPIVAHALANATGSVLGLIWS
jgi:membrane protease YdiL (CAAX protease family)